MRVDTEGTPRTGRNDHSAHDQLASAVGLGGNVGPRDIVARIPLAERALALPAAGYDSGRQLGMICDTVVRTEERTAVSVRAPKPSGDRIVSSLGALSLREGPGSVRLLDASDTPRRETPAGCGVGYQPTVPGEGFERTSVGVSQCELCQVSLLPGCGRCPGCRLVLSSECVVDEGCDACSALGSAHAVGEAGFLPCVCWRDLGWK